MRNLKYSKIPESLLEKNHVRVVTFLISKINLQVGMYAGDKMEKKKNLRIEIKDVWKFTFLKLLGVKNL